MNNLLNRVMESTCANVPAPIKKGSKTTQSGKYTVV